MKFFKKFLLLSHKITKKRPNSWSFLFAQHSDIYLSFGPYQNFGWDYFRIQLRKPGHFSSTSSRSHQFSLKNPRRIVVNFKIIFAQFYKILFDFALTLDFDLYSWYCTNSKATLTYFIHLWKRRFLFQLHLDKSRPKLHGFRYPVAEDALVLDKNVSCLS